MRISENLLFSSEEYFNALTKLLSKHVLRKNVKVNFNPNDS